MDRFDRLIPAELLADPDAQLRSRVLVGSCFGLGGLGLITVVVRLATTPFSSAPVVASALIAVVLSLPWLQRRTRSHRLAGGALVASMIGVFGLLHVLNGAFPGPSIVLFAIVPLLGAFFVSPRFGGLSAALVGALALALKLGLPAQSGPQIAALSWTFAAVAVVAPLMCFVVAAAYEHARARSEAQLQAANLRSEEASARAEAASRSKTEFLRHVSHELRTPLNAILGYGELIQEELGDASADQVSRDVEQITHASEQLLALINDLLDISRIEAGASDLEIRETDLAALLTQVCETARPLMAANHNTLSRVVADDLPRVATDARRLTQVLLNLLGNAGKFTERGEIILSARGVPGGVCLGVRDTGIGMSASQRLRIFEPFVQVDPSARRRQQGSGLGLALSRQLVMALGGSIEVVSEVGRGTEFTVRLPHPR